MFIMIFDTNGEVAMFRTILVNAAIICLPLLLVLRIIAYIGAEWVMRITFLLLALIFLIPVIYVGANSSGSGRLINLLVYGIIDFVFLFLAISLFIIKAVRSKRGDKPSKERYKRSAGETALYVLGLVITIAGALFALFVLLAGLQGNGQRGVFEGRIVGLSNRLNTILVPESFVQWSNAKYGEHGGAVQPSRVIVATTRAVDEPMRNFFTQKGYQIEGDHADGGKALQILQLAASGMAVVGLAFSAMAFYVLLLSIFLLLQRNSRKMENLLLLGYSPRQVARPYELLTLGLNVCVLVIALVLVWLVRSWYLPELAAAQEHYLAASTGFTLLCGIGLALLLTVLNSIAIRRKVNGLTLRHKSKI